MKYLPKLKYWREQKAMTVRQLAEAAKTSSSTVTLLENGHRPANPSTIARLARALEVKPAELYAEVDNQPKENFLDLLTPIKAQEVVNTEVGVPAPTSALIS